MKSSTVNQFLFETTPKQSSFHIQYGVKSLPHSQSRLVGWSTWARPPGARDKVALRNRLIAPQCSRFALVMALSGFNQLGSTASGSGSDFAWSGSVEPSCERSRPSLQSATTVPDGFCALPSSQTATSGAPCSSCQSARTMRPHLPSPPDEL